MLALFVTVVLNKQEEVCIYSLLTRRYMPWNYNILHANCLFFNK